VLAQVQRGPLIVILAKKQKQIWAGLKIGNEKTTTNNSNNCFLISNYI
jgi:hypothetical protein